MKITLERAENGWSVTIDDTVMAEGALPGTDPEFNMKVGDEFWFLANPATGAIYPTEGPDKADPKRDPDLWGALAQTVVGFEAGFMEVLDMKKVVVEIEGEKLVEKEEPATIQFPQQPGLLVPDSVDGEIIVPG